MEIVTAIEIWSITCIILVFAALCEYALILYLYPNPIDGKLDAACNKYWYKNGLGSPEVQPTPAPEPEDKISYSDEKGEVLKPSKPLNPNDEKAMELKRLRKIFKLRRMDKISLTLFPIIFFLYNVAYWGYYLNSEKSVVGQGVSMYDNCPENFNEDSECSSKIVNPYYK